MISRRSFVNAVGAGIVGTSAVAGQPPPARRRRLAVVTTSGASALTPGTWRNASCTATQRTGDGTASF